MQKVSCGTLLCLYESCFVFLVVLSAPAVAQKLECSCSSKFVVNCIFRAVASTSVGAQLTVATCCQVLLQCADGPWPYPLLPFELVGTNGMAAHVPREMLLGPPRIVSPNCGV